ncbi:MAG: peptidase M61 protein [uncultured bacterium]|nr:MAG: peptidase M61 protein [uncultured bacterium]
MSSKKTFFNTLLLVSSLLFFSNMFADEISYSLSMPKPSTHYFHVQMIVSKIPTKMLEVQMPAWTPGVMSITDFARYIIDVNAYSSDHQKLPFHKIDKQTWQIENGHYSSVMIDYQVYASSQPATNTSSLTNNSGFINGTSVFMYVVNGKDSQSNLTVNVPQGWQILSAAGKLGQHQFTFSNYDLLADHSIQLGKFYSTPFNTDKTHDYLSVTGDYTQQSIKLLLHETQLIEKTAESMLPLIDTKHYTNFFQFIPNIKDPDGLEHLDDFLIIDNQPLTSHDGKSLDNTIDGYPLMWVIAHEFVHRWNVKRLRPANLGPFDYSKEVYTHSFWFVEGATSYIGDLILLKSGLWSKQDFYNHMSQQMTLLNKSRGQFVRSMEQASFDIWLKDQKGGPFWNSVWSDPHIKGELICWMMDLSIRHLTHNKKNFLDFFNLFYNRMYVQAKPDSYYLKGRGYTTQDIVQALQDTTQTDWHEFFKKNIASPGQIAYGYYLQYAKDSQRCGVRCI